MIKSIATPALLLITFAVGLSSGLFLLPFWIGPFISAIKNGNPSDWIGFAGNFGAGIMTLIAATVAWFAVQKQIDQANRTAEEASRLRAQEKFIETAEKIDALMLARGYLRTFADNFPDPSSAAFINFDFASKLAELHQRKLVYLSQSAAAAPEGFGRSITTVMWRVEKLAEDTEDNLTRLSNRYLNNEIKNSVIGLRSLADSIDKRLPRLEVRLANLGEQVKNLGGEVEH